MQVQGLEVRKIEDQASKNKCAVINLALTCDHNHPCHPTYAGFVPLPLLTISSSLYFHTSVPVFTVKALPSVSCITLSAKDKQVCMR